MIVLTIAAAFLARCDNGAKRAQSGKGATTQAVYDQKTGRLKTVTVDANKNHRMETRAYLDGTRVLRVEMDENEDGRVDRWEYYGPDHRLEKVGFSRADDGKVDAWAYQGRDGLVERIEISTRRDDRVSRTEYYAAGQLVRADEDTDGDGRLDRWETFLESSLASVAFDTRQRGIPERRFVYNPRGELVRVETLP